MYIQIGIEQLKTDHMGCDVFHDWLNFDILILARRTIIANAMSEIYLFVPEKYEQPLR